MLLQIYYLHILKIMKKHKLLSFILIVILIIYISSYYVSNSGYYEYHMQERTILTNEMIKEFEDDVKNNRSIDVKDYLSYEDETYNNVLTDIVYNLSMKGVNLSRKCIKAIFKKLNRLIQD